MGRRRTNQFHQLLGLLNIWVIGGAIIIACALLLISFILLRSTQQVENSDGIPKALLSVINVSTSTPTLDNLSLESNTATPPLAPPPGVLANGAYIQVLGTGGDGLRLRDQPGLDGQVLLLASEAEVFQVTDGPVELDGFTWWYLVGPFDETRFGWGVSNYLELVQKP